MDVGMGVGPNRTPDSRPQPAQDGQGTARDGSRSGMSTQPVFGTDPDQAQPTNGGLNGSDMEVTPAVMEQPPGVEEVFGDWYAMGNIGNCFSFYDWLQLELDGTAVFRVVNDDACSGFEILAELPGTYTLDGQKLHLNYEGEGIPLPFEMREPAAVPAKRYDLMTVAIGTLPAASWQGAGEVLDDRAFVQLDDDTPGHYESERIISIMGAAGELQFEQEVLMVLDLDPPPPLAVGETGQAMLSVHIYQYDAAQGPTETSDMFGLLFEVTAVEHAELGSVELMPSVFVGLPNTEIVPAWEAMLANQGLSALPEAFQWTFRQRAFPVYAYRTGEPSVLSRAFVGSAQYTKTPSLPFTP